VFPLPGDALIKHRFGVTTTVWAALALGSGLHLERVPFSQATCTWMLCLTYLFFGVGYSILNRRYR
jgi:hypothetical protein